MKRLHVLSLVTLSLVFMPLAAALHARAAEQTRPINLDVTAFKLGKLAYNFAYMAEAELEAPEELLARTITLRLDGVRWQTALNAICDTAGCSWKLFESPRRLVIEMQDQSSQDGESPLNESVTFELLLADAREVLQSFGSVGGYTVRIDASIQGWVSMRVTNVRLETALDVVCESIGCNWLVEGKELVVRPTLPIRGDWPAQFGERIQMSLIDAPACEVLSALSRISQTEVLCPDFLQNRRVTVEAHDLPADAVLAHLAEEWSVTWHFAYGKLSPEPASTQARTQAETSEALGTPVSIDLVEASACDVLKALSRISGLNAPCVPFLEPKAITIRADGLETKQLLDQLCEQWGCTWKVLDGGLFLEARRD